MAIYERHTPESTVLYQTIARTWPALFMEYAASDAPIAEHVETEVERYLRFWHIATWFYETSVHIVREDTGGGVQLQMSRFLCIMRHAAYGANRLLT